jgi:Tol biopolymer transport system component
VDASPRFTRLTDQDGIELFPSLSPGGDFFVYAKEDGGDLDVFLQRAGGTQAINLTADSPVDDSLPAFSPDGDQIVFRSERQGGGLFLMGATGENVRRIAEAGYNASFSPDGREIAWSTVPVQDPVARQELGRIWRLDLATGRRRLVVEEDAVQPSWSPHGRRIAFWGIEKGTSRRRVWTVPADGGGRVPVTDSASIDWSPVWSTDGRFLYFVSDRSGSMNLWRVRIDETTGQVLQEPEAVVIPSPWIGYPGFSRDGRRMIYTTRERRSTIEKVALDAATWTIRGTPVQITRGVRDLAYVSASPDGTWLVFKTADSPEDLFLIHPDGSGFRQITDDPAKDRSPVWFPDGRILFSSDRSGKYEAWSIRTDGGDLRRLTAIPDQHVVHPISSPDGRRLAFALGYRGAFWVDLTAPLERRTPRAFLPSGEALFPYCWSPDGTRLVGAGNAGLVLVSLPEGRARRLTPDGMRPICWKDSPDILFIDGRGGVSVLDSRTGTERQILARPDSVTFLSFDLSPDARWLYLLRTREEGDLWIRDAGQGTLAEP